MSTTEPAPKNRPGAKKGNRSRVTHGHYARKVQLRDITLLDISRQTSLGRQVCAKADAIFNDRGGRANCSELERDLVNRYLVTELLVQSIDCWLLEQPSLINKRRRSLYPIVVERNKLVETSLKLASAIGLDRQQKKIQPTDAVMIDV
jgi:hypothetical protein